MKKTEATENEKMMKGAWVVEMGVPETTKKKESIKWQGWRRWGRKK